MNLLPPPAWVKTRATFDLDFANLRYWGGRVDQITTFFAGSYGNVICGPQNGVPLSFAPDRNNILIPFLTDVPRITMGKGLWVNRNSVNTVLWCRDMTNAAWTKSSVTATKNQVGADGSLNGATLLTATGTNGTCLQALTVGSANTVSSAYVKRVTGTGTISMTQDGSTYTDITSLINSNVYTLVKVPNQTISNPNFGFKIGTNTDAIAVDMTQSEGGTNPTTPLPTTTVPVARGNEEPTMGTLSGGKSSGIYLMRKIFTSGGPWSFYCVYSGSPEFDDGWIFVSDFGYNCRSGANGTPPVFNGASTPNNANAGLGNMNKLAGKTTGAGTVAWLNGGAESSIATNFPLPQNSPDTHVGIGNNGAGNAAGPLDGYISRMTFWDHEMPDGFLQELTR